MPNHWSAGIASQSTSRPATLSAFDVLFFAVLAVVVLVVVFVIVGE